MYAIKLENARRWMRDVNLDWPPFSRGRCLRLR